MADRPVLTIARLGAGDRSAQYDQDRDAGCKADLAARSFLPVGVGTAVGTPAAFTAGSPGSPSRSGDRELPP